MKAKRFALPELVALIDSIEVDKPSYSDPYWRRIKREMPRLLKMMGGVDETHDALLLRETMGGRDLERAARWMGFVLGVEYARREAAKGGAR